MEFSLPTIAFNYESGSLERKIEERWYNYRQRIIAREIVDLWTRWRLCVKHLRTIIYIKLTSYQSLMYVGCFLDAISASYKRSCVKCILNSVRTNVRSQFRQCRLDKGRWSNLKRASKRFYALPWTRHLPNRPKYYFGIVEVEEIHTES